MVEENIECAFPNVEILLRILFALMITNCSAKRSFSQLKHKKNPNRTTMRKEKYHFLSLLMVEAELLRKIYLGDIIKDFARHKFTQNDFEM